MEKRKDFYLAVFMVLSLLEGVVSVYFLAQFPASRSRTLILIAILGGVVVLAGLLVVLGVRRQSVMRGYGNLMRRPGVAAAGLGAGLLLLVFALFFLEMTVLSYTYVAEGFFERLAPLVFWLGGLGSQFVILLWVQGYLTNDVLRTGLSVFSAFIVPLLFAGVLTVRNVDPDFYFDINREDHFVEWATTAFLLVGGLLAFWAAARARQGVPKYTWFYVLMGVGLILFALEEISWGQRVFGVRSTEFFLENSNQQEINAHNVMTQWTGIQTKEVAAVVLTLYGIVFPLLARSRWVSSLARRLRVVVPPLVTAVPYAFGSFLLLNIFSGREEEVGELFLSLALFLMILLLVLRPIPEVPARAMHSEGSG
jgi:hypothetical protein